jgi:hypothetical protein
MADMSMTLSPMQPAGKSVAGLNVSHLSGVSGISRNRPLSACMGLACLFAVCVTDAWAGPKHRTLHYSKLLKIPAAGVQPVSAIGEFRGEVSDSPPVSIDGEVTTIRRRNISTPVLNRVEQAKSTANHAQVAVDDRRYRVKIHSLRHGLARMAALYGDLGQGHEGGI